MAKSVAAIVIATAAIVLLASVRYGLIEKSKHRQHHANECINNLHEIDGAKKEWALENHKTTNDIPTWDDLRPFIPNRWPDRIPVCPWGGTYTIGKVGENPTCSFATNIVPAHTLWY